MSSNSNTPSWEKLQLLRETDYDQYTYWMHHFGIPVTNTPPSNVARGLFQNSPEGFASPFYQTHLMHSQEEVEHVAETQPTLQPKSKGRRQGKEPAMGDSTTPKAKPRNVQWSEQEDVVLLRCYMDVCTDPIVGTNQKYATLFKKIHENYEAARRDGMYPGLSSRTADSMRKRVSRVKEEISNWLNSYEKAMKLVGQRSGCNHDDVISSAQELHKEHPKFHNGFSMWKQWEALKHYPEYEMYLNWDSQLKKNQDGTGNTIDLDDDGGERMPSTDGSSGTKRYRLVDDSVSSPKRPVGRDKAKKMSKGGSSTVSGMDAIGEGFLQFNENAQQNLEYQRQRMEWEKAMHEKKIELIDKKEARRAKEEASRARELEVRESEAKNQRLAMAMQLWNNYDNLGPQQRAVADALYQELFKGG